MQNVKKEYFLLFLLNKVGISSILYVDSGDKWKKVGNKNANGRVPS